MGAIDLHPSAVVYDHSYYPRGSRTSASPTVGIHTTAATIWPGWSFGLWHGSSFGPQGLQIVETPPESLLESPHEFHRNLKGTRNHEKKTATWFKLLGLEKNTETLTAKPSVGLGSWNWGRCKRNSVWISPVSGSCNPRTWNCQEHGKNPLKRMA